MFANVNQCSTRDAAMMVITKETMYCEGELMVKCVRSHSIHVISLITEIIKTNIYNLHYIWR